MQVNQDTTKDDSRTTMSQETEYDVADDADDRHTPYEAAEEEAEKEEMDLYLEYFLYHEWGRTSREKYTRRGNRRPEREIDTVGVAAVGGMACMYLLWKVWKKKGSITRTPARFFRSAWRYLEQWAVESNLEVDEYTMQLTMQTLQST